MSQTDLLRERAIAGVSNEQQLRKQLLATTRQAATADATAQTLKSKLAALEKLQQQRREKQLQEERIARNNLAVLHSQMEHLKAENGTLRRQVSEARHEVRLSLSLLLLLLLL